MKITIAYFSGTGSTQYIADTFKNELEARDHSVEIIQIGRDTGEIQTDVDILIICYAVHACNAPKPVFDWVSNNEKKNGIPTAIISVSGGGEVTPNLACRVSLKRKLAKMNYAVFYEKMLVMPSNWIVPTKPIIINKLLEVLPFKVSFCVESIESGRKNLSFPGIGNRILSIIGKLEHYGAAGFGKRIKVSDSCNGCSVCVKKCPVGNIIIEDDIPVFNTKCTVCLQCIYCCPQKALSPGIGKFVTIKEGYSFSKLLQNRKMNVECDVKSETKGFLWLGVRRYLLNTDDMLMPKYKDSIDT